MELKEALRSFFEREKIEYYGVLAYSDCRETLPRLREKGGFEPKSAIIYVIPYYGGETVNLSRYAASRDYHIYIKELNSRLSSFISDFFPNSKTAGFGDHSPIDERDAALAVGLGIVGDNGLLINPKYGSYVFIGDMLTDIPPETLGAKKRLSYVGCEHCGMCKIACPTGILRGEGEECLSAITQKKGALSDTEANLMREYNTAWGCDICQSSCPHNKSPERTPIEFFLSDRVNELSEASLAAMSDEEFASRAFAWRGKKVVQRNLSVLNKKAN